MKFELSNDVLYDYKDAILNEEFTGFKEDYLVLHSLIRRYRPDSFLEIGTNMGRGTEIICNAIYRYHFEAKVFSLDLPTELAHVSLQHPISEGKGDKVGSLCKLPFIQLRGDSREFDFSKYPVEGYFVDGEHVFVNVYNETAQILKNHPTLVVYHDADIQGVWDGIIQGVKKYGKGYEIYRVEDTRIAYLLPK